MPVSTISGLLKRNGMGKLAAWGWSQLSAASARPGELIHIDYEKLGRIQGVPARRDRRRDPPGLRAVVPMRKPRPSTVRRAEPLGYFFAYRG
jgi:hypothetical protein